jgi:RNA-binding protein YlmH
MGGILSLGIERSVVGDIAVISESEAIVFVLDKIAPYIDAELTKIGRDRVKTEIFTPSPEFVIPRKFENMAIVVSSPRIDGIVKAITGKSREASADMVRAGLVELSYESVDDVSTQVHAGDILTVRGYGKYVIGDIVGETKSGRLRLTCKKYL